MAHWNGKTSPFVDARERSSCCLALAFAFDWFADELRSDSVEAWRVAASPFQRAIPGPPSLPSLGASHCEAATRHAS